MDGISSERLDNRHMYIVHTYSWHRTGGIEEQSERKGYDYRDFSTSREKKMQ